jgi:hypothetical protein
MSEKEQSFMRQVAIGTWHCFCPEARTASEAREAEAKRRIESFRRELQKIAGYNVDFDITVNGGCLEAVIDDLRFVAYEITSRETQERWTLVTLLGRCPSCGIETISEPIQDLTQLGKMLEKFEPFHQHPCNQTGHERSSYPSLPTQTS